MGFPRSGRAQTDDLYLIDAHSQATTATDLTTIVPLMDRGGVYRPILARIPSPPATIAQMMSIAALAKEYPDRIVPATVRDRAAITGTPWAMRIPRRINDA